MKILYQLKALGRSYRIQSFLTPSGYHYQIEIYMSRSWIKLINVTFFSYDDALDYLISYISGVIRSTAKLSPLS